MINRKAPLAIDLGKDGQYPSETIDVIAFAISKARVGGLKGDDLWRLVAVAVLDALNSVPREEIK